MKKLFVCVFVFVVLFCESSCSNAESRLIIYLKVGESYYLQNSNHIKYCGMISKNIFSISSNNRNSVNLFYPKDVSTISYYEGISIYNFKVLEVNPGYIQLKLISKRKE